MALLGPRDEELLRQLRHRIPPGRLQSQFRDRLYDLEIRKVICSTNAIVIWSLLRGVFDVYEGPVRSRDLRAGRGYLRLSSRRVTGRFDVRSASGGAIFAA
jgi:hypothetical protein